MSENVKTLPKREEVALENTWDLTSIFETDDAWEEKFKEIDALRGKSQQYKGTISNGSESLLQVIHHFENLYRPIETLYVYASMKNDQDTSNAIYQSMVSRAGTLYAKIQESMSWFEPELLTLSNETIEAYFNENKALEMYRHFIETITEKRPHILSSEQEEVLAGVSEIFGGASETFSILNNADLKFSNVTNEKGEEVQLSHGSFGQLLESKDRKVRKDAFDKMYETFEQFQHTLASTLSFNVKGDNIKAKVRNYTSAREAALSNDHLPESVYDTLVKVVNEHLPLLHRYVALRKKVLKLETLHSYDLYTSIIGDVPLEFTYEEAKAKSLVALQPLGEEYITKVKEAYQTRWIDIYENEGKRSGAYSGGSYDSNPYILLNWQDNLNNLYTLVHEMGHSMHSYFTRKNQPFIYGDYSIFLAEIASTTNENILTEHFLQTETDNKVRAFILNNFLDGFKGTIFRQTQFAEFEHFIHQEDAKGNPLTSDLLNEAYGNLNHKYYGEALERDDAISLEWSRIPHFYYNYYVFQYATGFAAACALSKKIVHGTSEDLENYLNYLKAGNSDVPLEVIKKAGVDMEKEDYLRVAFELFEERLNELEELLENL